MARMPNSQARGQCPHCGALNPYTTPICGQCHSRLPWAGSVTDPLGESLKKASDTIQTKILPTAARVTKPRDLVNSDMSNASSSSNESYIGFAILSAMLPCVGLIVALLSLGTPKKATACFIGSVIGFILGLCLLPLLLQSSG
jgi:hypothetical protein